MLSMFFLTLNLAELDRALAIAVAPEAVGEG